MIRCYSAYAVVLFEYLILMRFFSCVFLQEHEFVSASHIEQELEHLAQKSAENSATDVNKNEDEDELKKRLTIDIQVLQTVVAFLDIYLTHACTDTYTFTTKMSCLSTLDVGIRVDQY